MQLVLLLVGTQMPGAWRAVLEQAVHAPFGLSSWAHAVLFAGIAGVAAVHPLSWSGRQVLMLALCLALMTEGLQFFAIDRHPRWVDVGIDLAGAVVGWSVASACSNAAMVLVARGPGFKSVRRPRTEADV